MPRYNTIVSALLLAALSGYLLPWIVAPSASMTLNAFDLAEWTSLHPAQQTSSPPLLVPLLLRLHIMILVVILVLISRDRLPLTIVALAILPIALAQLPPLEFVTQFENTNYRQQFALAAVSVVLPFLLWKWLNKVDVGKVIIFLAALGIALAFVGQIQAEALYRLSLEEGSLGAGMILIVAAYSLMIVLSVVFPRQRRAN